ncbi:MAG: DCC1-like thiol-disulfide oxidoreductase family protein [Cyanobacteria bacterium J06632_3]
MYTVIYDGNCNLCVTLVQLLERLDQGQQFSYVPMQDEATLAEFNVSKADCEMGMILIAPPPEDTEQNASKDTSEKATQAQNSQRWQGSDAAEEIGRLLPFGEVFVQAYRAMPGAKKGGDRTYEFIRDNRYSLFGKRNTTYQPKYPACSDDSCSKAFS